MVTSIILCIFVLRIRKILIKGTHHSRVGCKKKKMTKYEFVKAQHLEKEYVEKYLLFDKEYRDGDGDIFCQIDKFAEVLENISIILKSLTNVRNIYVDKRRFFGEVEICVSYQQLENDNEFNERVNNLYSKYIQQELQKTEIMYQKELKKLNEKYGKWKKKRQADKTACFFLCVISTSKIHVLHRLQR